MSSREKIIFFSVIALSVILRSTAAFDDLPFIYHPDEPGYVRISQNMFRNLSPGTSFFNYPTLYFYINAAGYVPYYLAGLVTGDLSSREDVVSPETLEMGISRTGQPSSIITGRVLSILFGTAAVFLLFHAALELTGSAGAGLLAAGLMAVSPVNVMHSRFITPDIYVTFFSVATLWGAVKVYKRGRLRDYLTAGACIGFTASSKYNGILVALFVVTAHLLRHKRRFFTAKGLYLSAVCAVAAFFITSPCILLNFAEFKNDMQFEAEHYSSGHPGMEGNTLLWYLSFMAGTAIAVYLLSLAEVVRAVFKREPATILIASFPLVYFIFISSFIVRNDRTLLPATPFFFLLAALFITRLFSSGKTSGSKRLAVISGCLAVVQPFAQTVKTTVELLETDCRETAGNWIIENIPEGSRIALESYSPWVNPSVFDVQGVRKAIDNSPEWYRLNDFQYLVLSREMYGRYLDDPDRYSEEAEDYEEILAEFSSVAEFQQNSGKVIILAVE